MASRLMRRAAGVALATAMLPAVVAPTAAATADDPVRLHYLGRYDQRDLHSKHLVGVETVLGHYALAGASDSLCLVDLQPLVDGSTAPPGCISQIPGVDVTSTTSGPGGYLYANLRQGGLAIVHLDPVSLALTPVGEIAETDVFYEKMTVQAGRLFVAAHGYGIRIFDLTRPSEPELISSLDAGFTDAFAIAVDPTGEVAYVADGGGGLKVVDVSDPAAPAIVAGEDPLSAAGTAEDVLLHGGYVYVAVGGAGVAVYDPADLASRRLYDTPFAAKDLAVVGGRLSVADNGGLELFGIAADGALAHLARERAKYRLDGESLSLRLWYDVAAWEDDRVVVAGWDTLELYRLVDPAADDQPDITVSTQRIRFGPSGGTASIVVSNDGSGTLDLTGAITTQPNFHGQALPAQLAPGESVTIEVSYDGGQPGSARLLIGSNDPDEDPLPVALFGATASLDPGEPAIPFVLDSWTYDPATGQFVVSPFDLAAEAGRVVYFQVFTPG